jgi:hypothetical protein
MEQIDSISILTLKKYYSTIFKPNYTLNFIYIQYCNFPCNLNIYYIFYLSICKQFVDVSELESIIC